MADTDDDIAAAKAKEEEEAKKLAEAKAKADAEAKAKEEEEKKRKEEEARRSQPPQDLTEAQWVALEKAYGKNRQDILGIWAIAQAVQQNNPATKLLEKDAWAESIKGVSDISFFEEDARKAVEAMSPQDRQDPKKVRREIMAVRGEKMNSARGNDEVRRVASGFDVGGTGTEPRGTEDLPEFTGDSNEKHDQAEVFRKFGFKDKKDWKEHQSRVIPVQDENFKPIFRS